MISLLAVVMVPRTKFAATIAASAAASSSPTSAAHTAASPYPTAATHAAALPHPAATAHASALPHPATAANALSDVIGFGTTFWRTCGLAFER